MIAITMTVIF